jgi:hypothetical protein
MEELICSAGRTPRQRTTLYGSPPVGRTRASFGAPPLAEPVNPPVNDAGLERPRRLLRPVKAPLAVPSSGRAGSPARPSETTGRPTRRQPRRY